MKKYILTLLVLMFAVLLAACAEDKGYSVYKGMSAQQIFTDGEKALAKHNYNDAAKHFEGIDALYPFDKLAQQAELDVIYAYYKADDAAAALAAADKYIHLYPDGEHTDYALYMKGLINFERGKSWLQKMYKTQEDQRNLDYAKQSFQDFNDLIEQFPKSIYVRDAYERMVYIRDLLAHHELSVAQFYFDRKAYVAAANRAEYVVNHFEGSSEVDDALKIMIRSYRALGAKQQEAEVTRILQLNFPQEKV